VDKMALDGQNRPMTLIGYARVSTEEQQTDPQLDALQGRRLPTVVRIRHGR